MGTKKTQLIVLVGALILFVLLFIAPKSLSKLSEVDLQKQKSQKNELSSEANLSVFLTIALKNTEPIKKAQLENLISQKKYDTLIVFWDKLKRPDLAAHFTEAQAQLSQKADKWLKAGNRYYYAIQFSDDKTEIPVLYQSAMRCYNKNLALDPNNIDAKIMIASCYVEGTENPMEGISKLKKIEKIDSNNVKLQLTFAFFSVKSGQLDKAISRFKKVIQSDSNYIEAYLHLADAFEKQKNNSKAIEMLQKYISKTNDITAKNEINNYIEQLKNNIN